MEAHSNPAFENDEKHPPSYDTVTQPDEKPNYHTNGEAKRSGSPKVGPLETQNSIDEDIRRKMDQEPLRFCKFISEKPKLAFGKC